MIRVELPAHLRTLAQVDSEVKIDVESEATQRSVLDAIEACYPLRRGTICDHVSQRRPFLHFFAAETDPSHEPPDAALRDAVASGQKPLIIIRARLPAVRRAAPLRLPASPESAVTDWKAMSRTC
jgi:hypothetical protein